MNLFDKFKSVLVKCVVIFFIGLFVRVFIREFSTVLGCFGLLGFISVLDLKLVGIDLLYLKNISNIKLNQVKEIVLVIKDVLFARGLYDVTGGGNGDLGSSSIPSRVPIRSMSPTPSSLSDDLDLIGAKKISTPIVVDSDSDTKTIKVESPIVIDSDSDSDNNTKVVKGKSPIGIDSSSDSDTDNDELVKSSSITDKSKKDPRGRRFYWKNEPRTEENLGKFVDHVFSQSKERQTRLLLHLMRQRVEMDISPSERDDLLKKIDLYRNMDCQDVIGSCRTPHRMKMKEYIKYLFINTKGK